MSEIVKCSACRKILTREEFQSHECKIPWETSKEIPVLYYFDCSTDEKEQMVGVGLDGVRYWLVVKKPKPIPFIRRIFTTKKTDDNFTECGVLKRICCQQMKNYQILSFHHLQHSQIKRRRLERLLMDEFKCVAS